MSAFIQLLLDAGYIWAAILIVIVWIIGKYILKGFTVFMVCKNKDLSNEKVTSITQMVSKNSFKF